MLVFVDGVYPSLQDYLDLPFGSGSRFNKNFGSGHYFEKARKNSHPFAYINVYIRSYNISSFLAIFNTRNKMSGRIRIWTFKEQRSESVLYPGELIRIRTNLD